MNARTTWGTALLLAAAAGCTSKDADHLARIGKQTVSRASSLTKTSDGQPLGGWQLVRTGLDDIALDARVSSRLRWDKALAETRIQVRADGGLVELSGSVGTLAQRRRAVELAETTEGVEKVVDSLVTSVPSK